MVHNIIDHALPTGQMDNGLFPSLTQGTLDGSTLTCGGGGNKTIPSIRHRRYSCVPEVFLNSFFWQLSTCMHYLSTQIDHKKCLSIIIIIIIIITGFSFIMMVSLRPQWHCAIHASSLRQPLCTTLHILVGDCFMPAHLPQGMMTVFSGVGCDFEE